MSNVIDSQRTRKPSRRHAYATALQNVSNISAYSLAFSTILGSYKSPSNVRIHQSTLPPEPKSWKDMLAHPHSPQFKLAADKEFNDLFAKNTFEYIDISSANQEESPLPLLWVFKYKFDSDGYLIKHKARLLTKEAPKLNTKLKHVDIYQNWLRQEV
jgi:hypothetical protein